MSVDPMSPMSADEVLATLRALQAADLPAHGGRTLAYVYDSGLADADALGLEALAQFASSNALDPTAFPSLLRMENDLVAMAGALLDAPDGFAGSVTSGGTESILLAVLAAREGASGGAPTGEPAPGSQSHASGTQSTAGDTQSDASVTQSDASDTQLADEGTQSADGGTVPRGNIVLPVTAHAAFLKAAKYFGLEPRVVDVDPGTLRADPAAMAAAVDDDTVLLVASAPSYAHGVVDPVTEIAALAAERGIRCHVDACIGGWVLPHLEGTPPWTFTVPGVTSISVDLHKYAYTPKGVSVLLHRTAELRRGHFFASADWPGYTMLNSTMQSTKSGGPLAAAWAVTHHIGTQGYAGLARAAHDATLEIAEAARGIEGLQVFAEPDSTLLALATDGSCDVFTIADEMLVRGWFVQPQMTYRDLPPTLHLTLSAATAPSAGAFVDDLREAVAAARESGPVAVDPGLGQLLGSLDPASLDDAAFGQLLGAAGLAGEGGAIELPQRMAPVNALLDACPAPLREALLLGVLDRLSRPTPG